MWFFQQRDHFDHFNTKGWFQRYWMEEFHYRPGGPVFLHLCGESEAPSLKAVAKSSWMKLAKEVGAVYFVLEHRYYSQFIVITYMLESL